MPSASPHDPTSPPGLEKRQKVPQWLAVSTAALAIPAVLLWRQKKTLAVPQQLVRAQNSSSSAPPARRKPAVMVASSPSSSQSPLPGVGGRVSAPPRRSRTSSVKPVEHSTPTRPSTVSSASLTPKIPTHHPRASGFIFDTPLLSLGAFGLATAAVGVSAVLGVWGVQRSLGVTSVDEFATRVRELLLRYIPDLSRRLYRQSNPDDGPLPVSSSERTAISSWSWEEAENRLSEAYEKGGVATWAVSAMSEMEAEQENERRRRGL